MDRKLTPLTPATLIACVASSPPSNTLRLIACSTNFWLFGTAACSPTPVSLSKFDVLRKRASSCADKETPGVRLTWIVTTRLFLL